MSPEHAKRMVARFKVPGFQNEFNKRFIEESRKHPLGTVDDEALSKTILKELGQKDPAESEPEDPWPHKCDEPEEEDWDEDEDEEWGDEDNFNEDEDLDNLLDQLDAPGLDVSEDEEEEETT